jgi:hypothetical protein
MKRCPGSVAAVVAVFAFALQVAHATDPAFSNRTVQAGVAVQHSTSGFVQLQYTGGGAVGDFNRDGFSDFFFISGGSGGKPDALFINNGDGTFTDEAQAWGLTAVHRGKSACVGDFDNDGFLDLYVGRYLRFGPGMREFEVDRGIKLGLGPQWYEAQRGVLLMNEQGRHFRDATAAAGLGVTQGKALGVAFGDPADRGRDDLFIANDGKLQDYFENDGRGSFRSAWEMNAGTTRPSRTRIRSP